MLNLENKNLDQLWLTRDAVTYVGGLSEAPRLLECSINEIRKVVLTTVEILEVTQ